MNELNDIFKQYRYGALAVANKYRFRKNMHKNEKINIKALQNGYLVERSWRERRSDDVLDYNYAEEEFMFKTWAEVVDFISKNELEIPPQKI